jgi:hypothetical protein
MAKNDGFYPPQQNGDYTNALLQVLLANQKPDDSSPFSDFSTGLTAYDKLYDLVDRINPQVQAPQAPAPFVPETYAIRPVVSNPVLMGALEKLEAGEDPNVVMGLLSEVRAAGQLTPTEDDFDGTRLDKELSAVAEYAGLRGRAASERGRYEAEVAPQVEAMRRYQEDITPQVLQRDVLEQQMQDKLSAMPQGYIKPATGGTAPPRVDRAYGADPAAIGAMKPQPDDRRLRDVTSVVADVVGPASAAMAGMLGPFAPAAVPGLLWARGMEQDVDESDRKTRAAQGEADRWANRKYVQKGPEPKKPLRTTRVADTNQLKRNALRSVYRDMQAKYGDNVVVGSPADQRRKQVDDLLLALAGG